MLRLALLRLLSAVPTLVLVIVACFLLVRLSPGSPFASERALAPEVQAALRTRYGLDQPLWQQGLRYTARLVVHGDFGPSIKYPGRTVGELIAGAWPATALLAVSALAVGLVLATLLALPGVVWPGSLPARLADGATAILLGTPSFVLGPLLILALARPALGLPVAGFGEARHLVLPSLTLGAVIAGSLARVLSTGWRQAMAEDYMRTARAKGLSPSRLLFRHALWAGMGPLLALLGPVCAGLLAGSVAVEQIFNVPGLGPYLVDAAQNRDYFLIMGIVVVDACLLIGLNVVADVALLWCDPRLRTKADTR